MRLPVHTTRFLCGGFPDLSVVLLFVVSTTNVCMYVQLYGG